MSSKSNVSYYVLHLFRRSFEVYQSMLALSKNHTNIIRLDLKIQTKEISSIKRK